MERILLLGSGGREHALAWKIAQSPKVEKLYIAPGNAGTALAGENVAMKADDFEGIRSFVLANAITMVVVGPEDPLVKGIYDYFKADAELASIPVIGPSKEGAVLEGSKDFAKGFMQRHGIPTAAYQTFTGETLEEGKAFLRTLQAPYVLKADGLCAGKGVLILDTLEEAEKELEEMLGEDFMDIFETSPIPASIEITLNADYVSTDSLEVVKTKLAKSDLVAEVNYQASLVDALNANLSRISLILAFFIALMLFISYVLINNTVRLNVFARRFTIHTMKLVGATRSFIRAPFLVQAAFQGVFSAFIAIIALVAILFFLRNGFEQLFEIFRLDLLLLVMAIVLVSGLVICLTSTYFVVNKLVSLKKEELYY